MKLNKAKGNMFKSVTHTGSFFFGCDHGCVYCWARILAKRRNQDFTPRRIQLDDEEILSIRDATIFLSSSGDPCCPGIKDEDITAMFNWIARQDLSNTFLVQTKNPQRLYPWLMEIAPKTLEEKPSDNMRRLLIGTTVETDVNWGISKAPPPKERAFFLSFYKSRDFRTFLSLEPLLRFNLDIMLGIVDAVKPEVIEIGLDNWKHEHHVNLKQPRKEDYMALRLQLALRQKTWDFTVIEKVSIGKWLKDLEVEP